MGRTAPDLHAQSAGYRQTTWKDVLEPLMLMERILQKDPAGGLCTDGF